jgi:hypothetical protein
MNVFLIMTLSAAMLGALQKVAAAERYQNKWLSGCSTAAIINFEFNLSGDSQVEATKLNAAVARKYNLCNESNGAELIGDKKEVSGCLFRWKCGRTQCYYLTATKDITPPADKGGDSIHEIADVQLLFTEGRACVTTVTDEMRTTLADLIKKTKGKANAPALSSTPDAEKAAMAVTEEKKQAAAFARRQKRLLKRFAYQITMCVYQ